MGEERWVGGAAWEVDETRWEAGEGSLEGRMQIERDGQNELRREWSGYIGGSSLESRMKLPVVPCGC